MNKKKKQAIIWMIVWAVVTILPFLTLYYFGFFAMIIIPFSGFILIKLIKDFFSGRYD